MRRYLVILVMILLSPSFGAAQPVVVSILGAYDVQSLDIGDNQTAILRVFLQSFGGQLDGQIVALYRDSDKKELKKVVSSTSGEIYFNGLPPGRYTVALIKSKQGDTNTLPVKIGDIRLSASGNE